MSQPGSSHKRSVAWRVGIPLLGLFLLFILLDPLPFFADIYSVLRIRRELPRARERWESQAITDYRVNVKGFVPLSCILEGELTVQEARLVQVRLRENPLVPDTPLQIIDPDRWDQDGCSFQDLTVEAMFERVDASLQKIGLFGAPLTIQFDDTLGYITEYHFGRDSSGGIFGARVSDCCTWFEFSNLTVPAP